MLSLSQKWTGPACVAIGVFLLVAQVFAWITAGLLHSWLIGGGIGFLLVGGIAWFHYLDDRRSATIVSDEEPDRLPTADEFDAMYTEQESTNESRDDEPPHAK